MEPIATYDEVTFEGRRSYALYADVVRVVGAVPLRAHFESEIPLARICPTIERLWLRHRSFWHGLAIAIVSYLAVAFMVSGLHVDPCAFVTVLAGVIGLSGLMLAATTARKTEYARFLSDAGLPVLDVARSRKDPASVDRFIAALVEQSRRCRVLA